MTHPNPEITPGCRVAQAGPLSQWDALTTTVPPIPGISPTPRLVSGKGFFKDLLQMDSMELSLNALPPQMTSPVTHRHQENDELYLFLSGTGKFWSEGVITPITPGSVFYLKPNVNRALRNTGSDPLCYAVVQAQSGSLKQHTFEDGIKTDTQIQWE